MLNLICWGGIALVVIGVLSILWEPFWKLIEQGILLAGLLLGLPIQGVIWAIRKVWPGDPEYYLRDIWQYESHPRTAVGVILYGGLMYLFYHLGYIFKSFKGEDTLALVVSLVLAFPIAWWASHCSKAWDPRMSAWFWRQWYGPEHKND